MTDKKLILPEDFGPLHEHAEKLAIETLDLCALAPQFLIAKVWVKNQTTMLLVSAMTIKLRELDRPSTRDHWLRWAIERHPDRRRELNRCRNNPRRLMHKLLKIDKEI